MDDRMDKQDREVVFNIEQAVKNVDKTKKEHEIEVQGLEKSWSEKCKTLEEKRAELEDKVRESETKLREVQMEILNIRIGKEQALQELENDSSKKIYTQIETANKDLEGKLRIADNNTDQLNKRILDLIEEIKQQQSKYGDTLLRCEKENNKLRQEFSNIQKTISIKFSEGEKMNHEMVIANSILEVT